MKNKTQVVMLPSNEKASLKLGQNGLLVSNTLGYDSHFTNQHLYFLSDEEIKEGDWFIHPDSSCFDKECIEVSTGGYEIKQVSKVDKHFVYHGIMAISKSKNVKKVIATTNGSLAKTIKSFYLQFGDEVEETKLEFLPQPSQDFISYFVEEYNKGNVIEWVNVEYEKGRYVDGIVDCGDDDLWDSGYYEPDKLKVNTKNEICIRKIKDNWNREEHIANIKKFAEEFVINIAYKQTDIDKWIAENL